MIPRRTVLRAALLPALLSAPVGAAGCADPFTGSVRVAVTWSGWELAMFRRVLSAFERDQGFGTEVVPLGDDIGAVLGSRTGGAPDVVLLPRVWQVRRYAAELSPLEEAWPGKRFPDPWRSFLTAGGRVRGVPFKVAHKSVVWYRKDVFDEHGLSPPTSWPAWLELNQRLADHGVAPLALGAADGWVLADFFENVLLGLHPLVYRQLAQGEGDWSAPAVVEAFEHLGTMWSAEGAISGGIARALLTQSEAAIVDHFRTGRAAMVAGADFDYPVIARHAPPGMRGDWLDWFRFPVLAGPDLPPPKVGGDIAVVPGMGTPGGRALAGWLATVDAARIWARNGGFSSVQEDMRDADYPWKRLADIADELRRPDPSWLAFDLADQLGALGGDGDGGLWRVLQDFLRAVDGADASRVRLAAAGAAARMAELAARMADGGGDR
jgi:alpha-glucoside transport system substrate-binding protein